jgi:hypothetical protein
MNREELLSAGYKFFEDHLSKSNGGYQKCIYSETGKRYFINVYYYDFSQYKMPYTEGYACKLQFEVKDDYLNLEFGCRDLTIEQLESKVEWLFTTLGAKDYE